MLTYCALSLCVRENKTWHFHAVWNCIVPSLMWLEAMQMEQQKPGHKIHSQWAQWRGMRPEETFKAATLQYLLWDFPNYYTSGLRLFILFFYIWHILYFTTGKRRHVSDTSPETSERQRGGAFMRWSHLQQIQLCRFNSSSSFEWKQFPASHLHAVTWGNIKLIN